MFGIFIPEKKNCLISGKIRTIGGMFGKPAYATQLKEMRQAMVDHLAERDENFRERWKIGGTGEQQCFIALIILKQNDFV